MTVVHPLDRAWVSTGGTGSQNYDEFADDAEITGVVAARPHAALGVEMPHRAPDSLGDSFADALPAALRRLAQAKEAGAYRPVEGAVGVYRITGERTGATSYGLFGMVDTDQISTRADEPGVVIRNEDVFAEKVRERVALIETTRHLLSAVLLLQTEHGQSLQDALVAVCGGAGEPDVRDTDEAGRVHEVWVVTDPDTVERLCALAGGGELVVADGNHRSLAAQSAGLPRFLAVVTIPTGVDLRPYHRLISSWPADRQPVQQALADAGAEVRVLEGAPEVPPEPGVVHVYAAGTGYAVRLPVPEGATGVATLDHALLERVLVAGVLEFDPGDSRIRYIGGDYPASWLRGQVDAGVADVAVLIAPVRVDDFVAVNLDRERMPRKSTWFTPKARAGLVVADLGV